MLSVMERTTTPATLRWIMTAIALSVVAAYAWHGRLHDLLWLSNVALLGTTLGLWLRSRLLISMQALVGIVPEIGWTADAVSGLLLGDPLLGQTGYLFDPTYPPLMKAAALFHPLLPPALLWLVWKLGYDRRALAAQSLLTVAVLALSYLALAPRWNVNRVHGFGPTPGSPLPDPAEFTQRLNDLLVRDALAS